MQMNVSPHLKAAVDRETVPDAHAGHCLLLNLLIHLLVKTEGHFHIAAHLLQLFTLHWLQECIVEQVEGSGVMQGIV